MAFDDIIGETSEPSTTLYVRDLKWEKIKDRVGRFSISIEFIIKFSGPVLKIFSEILILSAAHNLQKDEIEYAGHSINFDEIKGIAHCDDAPYYHIFLDSTGKINYKRI